MANKAEQNLKEMKDIDEKFRKRKGQYSDEDMRLKKSYSEGGVSSHRPSRFQGGLDKRPSICVPSRTIIGPQQQTKSLLGRSGGPRTLTHPQCPHCGKNHPGEC